MKAEIWPVFLTTKLSLFLGEIEPSNTNLPGKGEVQEHSCFFSTDCRQCWSAWHGNVFKEIKLFVLLSWSIGRGPMEYSFKDEMLWCLVFYEHQSFGSVVTDTEISAIIAAAVMCSDSMNQSHKLRQLVIFFTQTLTSCRGGQSEQHALRVCYEEQYITYPPNKCWYIVEWAKRFSTDKYF